MFQWLLLTHNRNHVKKQHIECLLSKRNVQLIFNVQLESINPKTQSSRNSRENFELKFWFQAWKKKKKNSQEMAQHWRTCIALSEGPALTGWICRQVGTYATHKKFVTSQIIGKMLLAYSRIHSRVWSPFSSGVPSQRPSPFPNSFSFWHIRYT